jgi:hypothetical protein
VSWWEFRWWKLRGDRGIGVSVEVRNMSTDRICKVAVMVRVGGILGEDLGEGLVMIGWMFAAVRGDG